MHLISATNGGVSPGSTVRPTVRPARRMTGRPAATLGLFCGALLFSAVFHTSVATRAEEPAASAVDAKPEDLEFFEKRIRPLLVERCFSCHSAQSDKLKGGLQLDSRAAVLRGGDIGPAAVPGDPAKSLLIEAVGYKSQTIQMPPEGKLTDAEIGLFEEWVRRGLPFPAAPATSAAKSSTIDWEAGRRHWAFQPLRPRSGAERMADVPATAELRTAVDPWVAAARQRQGLEASAEAERATLVRRLKFDLLGLPPTPDEIDEFTADDRPDAYERLVDRYLASPRLGERWGRYWLDLVRYCDVPEQWREGEAQAYWYRDWVVRSMNDDRPLADFIRRQLAADLLSDSRPEDLAALGLLGLSPSYWKELKLDHLVIQQVVAEEWEERIETLGGALLGLTLACARCHDHKFEPVSTADYYALAGVLASTRQEDRPVIPQPEAQRARDARAKAKQLQAELDKQLAVKPPTDESRVKVEQLQGELAVVKATPYFDLPPAYGVSESSLYVLPDGPNRTKLDYRAGQAQDVAIQIRGNPARLGPVVPRRFLTVLSSGSQPPAPFREGSGRRELADAIVGDAGPLTARVFVNRIWRHHFGRGLATSPSNLGLQSEPPTHPELLDDLAERFLARDGSIKWLHRELVTSAVYRQSSRRDERRDAIDPENVWLSRMSVRRLEVEAWRDAMLAAADDLDGRIGGPPRELVDAGNRRRTLYGTVRRRELADLLRLYDFPDPIAHAAARQPTTTPLQQLFVLNSPYFLQRSEALTASLEREAPGDPAQQIEQAYRRLFGRRPDADERQAGLDYLGAAPSRDAWLQYAQVLLGSNEFGFVD